MKCLSLSVWWRKIAQSKTQSSTGHLETVLSVFQSLSLSLALVGLSHSGNVSKPTVGRHHKQIMSNCKCVWFLKGGGRGAKVNGVSLPPSSGFALPARRPTELGFDSVSGCSVRDRNGHSPHCILSLLGKPM